MTPLAAWLTALLTRWRQPPPNGAVLAVEQVVALDPRRRLTLVRCGGRRLLLLTGGPADLSLGWLPEDAA